MQLQKHGPGSWLAVCVRTWGAGDCGAEEASPADDDQTRDVSGGLNADTVKGMGCWRHCMGKWEPGMQYGRPQWRDQNQMFACSKPVGVPLLSSFEQAL